MLHWTVFCFSRFGIWDVASRWCQAVRRFRIHRALGRRAAIQRAGRDSIQRSIFFVPATFTYVDSSTYMVPSAGCTYVPYVMWPIGYIHTLI